jgi:predicted TIM-barrel fold metal-dependent hydrolase
MIDMHAHTVPAPYLAQLRRLGREPVGRLPPATAEVLSESMGRRSIDAATVSLSPPGVWFGDAGLARELSRMVNEEHASMARAEPARWAALATLPIPDVDGALAEIAHALDVLGLDGVALHSNVDGVYLGDPALEPIFVELDRRGAYAFLHPSWPPAPTPGPELPGWLVDFPFDTTRALVNLIYSGTLERHPNVRVQVAHMGGTAPFLADRIASWAGREPTRAEAAPAGARAYLQRLYYDTGLANNTIALATMQELAGIDRVVFGTDWPFLPESADVDLAAGLRLGTAELARIEHANAAALVPRLAGLRPATV